jgi:hypothetical protein
VIARVLDPPHFAIDACIDEALRGLPIQQQVVDAKPGVAFPPISPVVPECIHWRLRMELADGIDPSLIEKAPE